MPTALSTHPSKSKEIVWLLLNPVNDAFKAHSIKISGHDWLHMRTDEFMRGKVSEELLVWFDFRLKLSTLKLWSVSQLVPLFVYVLTLPILRLTNPSHCEISTLNGSQNMLQT